MKNLISRQKKKKKEWTRKKFFCRKNLINKIKFSVNIFFVPKSYAKSEKNFILLFYSHSLPLYYFGAVKLWGSNKFFSWNWNCWPGILSRFVIVEFTEWNTIFFQIEFYFYQMAPSNHIYEVEICGFIFIFYWNR